MKIGITYRLFLSLLGATCLAILSFFLVIRWSVDHDFFRYLGTIDQTRLDQLVGDLGQRYEEQGSWSFLEAEMPRWDPAGSLSPPDGAAARQPAAGAKAEDDSIRTGTRRLLRRSSRLIVLDGDRKPVLGSNPKNEEVNYRSIIVKGRTVGYVGFLSPKHFLHPVQVRFLSQQRLELTFAAAGIVVFVMIISLPLARGLMKPVKAMALATHDIASGHYDTRIPVTSSDELGQLARDFNDMATMLEKQEMARRQWVADISHELRTPLSVLRGEIEALLDGVRTITPERVRSLHGEVLRLSRLVDDLYLLSLSDIGAFTFRKEDLDMARLLKESLESYRNAFERKWITLTANIPDAESTIHADRERLTQLFGNLFENSLRYTDGGGELAVSLRRDKDRVVIEFQDSKPGVPDEDLDRLFDRLYRVDSSRSRRTGGAGLGLAIAKSIAEGHGGTVSAHHSPLGGLLIRVALPG